MRPGHLILIVGLALTGCDGPVKSRAAQQSPAGVEAAAPPEAKAPFLTTQEIARLFAESPVKLEPAPMDGLEIFYPDGAHVIHGRATTWGRYSIADGQLCVQRPENPPTCRSVFRGEDGELRFGTRPGSVEHSSEVQLVPVTIS